MDALLFLLKFGGVSILYFAVASTAVYGLGRLERKSPTFKQAGAQIGGTHLGRLRFLLVAAIVSFVLAMVYPGEPLLLPTGSVEATGSFLQHLLYGKDAAQPSVIPHGKASWFWGVAALVYLGTLVLYVVMVLPNMLSAAANAARVVWNNPKNPVPRSPRLVWAAVGAFAAVLAMYFIKGKRSEP